LRSLSSASPVGGALATLLAALTLGACSSGSSDIGADATLTVYASLPLEGGAFGAEGRDIERAAKLALDDAGGEAGGLAVEAVFLDDTVDEGSDARWTPAQAAANAREATQDSTAIAYLGEFQSGATRASLPVTNEARLLQVSPASTAVDLVAPFAGSRDLPTVQPSGERSFGRVIPADDAQAAAGAGWASELGWERIGILSERSEFGRTLASAFERQAGELGIATSAGLAPRLYLAGESGVPNPTRTFRGPEPVAIGSDAMLPPYGSSSAAGVYVTSPALDPTQLPASGQEFAERFEAEYGHKPRRYAAYGYEAMAVILDSIDRASEPGDRDSVIEAFFATADRDSVLGTYSIDEVGDTTLDRISGYASQNGLDKPVAELTVP
jgi:branched-chain amino acid transport system substrate-binding protein